MSKIRIALITNYPSHYQIDLFNEIAKLPEVDFNAIYLRKITIDRNWKKTKNIYHKHVFLKEINSRSHFYFNKGILSELSRIKPHIIIVTQYASITMQLILYYRLFINTPVVFWSERPFVEHTEVPIFNSNILRKVFRRIALFPLRWVDEVWGVGIRAVQYFRKTTRTCCINFPYFFDTKPFLQCIEDKSYIRPKILYAGKLNYRKGTDILLEVLKNVLMENLDVKIDIAGTGQYQKEMENLQEQFPEKLKYHGFKEIDEVLKLFAENNIFLFPTRYDGWGMVVAEAMSSGMIVISSINAGSAMDILRDNENGFVFNQMNADEITQKLKYVIDNFSNMRRIAKGGIESIKLYDAERGAEMFLKNVKKILERARR